MLIKTNHENNAQPSQPHLKRLATVWGLRGRAGTIVWTQRRGFGSTQRRARVSHDHQSRALIEHVPLCFVCFSYHLN